MPFFHYRNTLIQMKSIGRTIKLEQSVELTLFSSFTTIQICVALQLSDNASTSITSFTTMKKCCTTTFVNLNYSKEILHYTWHYRLLQNFNLAIHVFLYSLHFSTGQKSTQDIFSILHTPSISSLLYNLLNTKL